MASVLSFIVGILFVLVFAAVVVLTICIRIRLKNRPKSFIATDVISLILLAPGLLWADLALFDGNIAVRIAAWGNLALIIAGLCLSLACIRWCWVIPAFLGITYGLTFFYPMLYNYIFPNNNYAEDILWALYNPVSIGIILLIAALLTAMIWLCTRFFGRRHPKKWMGFALILIVAVCIVAALPLLRYNARPLKQANDVAPYSYLAAACNTDGAWGFINERGEVVIPFQYNFFEASMSFDNAFVAWLGDSTGDYLINEKGQCLRDDCYYYEFRENAQALIGETDSGYGIIDPYGQNITDFIYDTADDAAAAHPKLFPAPEDETLRILSDDDYGDYVIDENGTVIIPGGIGFINFGWDHKYLKVDEGWGITYPSENEIAHGGGCAVYDRQGNVVIPAKDTRGLWINNENGWILAQDSDRRFYYIDENENVLLDLGYDYEHVEGLVKVPKAQ